MTYDIRIVGGTIVDGSGGSPRRGDVGIRDGRVVALGRATEPARRTIEAAGRVVAPGFVDIHTHYDAQVLWDPLLSISPWHGVTSAVIGNCGFGMAPTRPEHRGHILRTFEKVEGMSLEALETGIGDDWGFVGFPGYLDRVEARGAAINLAVLLGHTPVRLYAMGEDAVRRAATPDELVAMRGLVEEALEAGAIGLATSHSAFHQGFSGLPVPSRLAPLDEISLLAGAVARRGGVLQASVGRTLFLDQFEALAREHDLTISWAALLAGMAGPGSHRRMLDRSHALAAAGLRILPQVACRPVNFDFDFLDPGALESRPVFEAVRGAGRDARIAAYRDPAFRAALKADFAEGRTHLLGGWAGRTVISRLPGEPALEERNLAEVAAGRGVDPIDLALDLSLETDFAARFRTALMNVDEAEVAELLADEATVLGLSDAGAHASQLCDACFSTHLLGHWVRERGTLTLERAVHMLSGRPAALFGLADRGLLAEGRPADVVVFDPATVGAGPLRRVCDQPAGAERLVSDASGIEAVLVNGVPVREAGRDALAPGDRLPGRVLRHGRAA